MDAGSWTSLEIVKLAASLITPVVVVLIGWQLNARLKQIEDRQWANRKLVERRLHLYDEMAPDLNRLRCFFRCVGDFRTTSPQDALAIKRRLDANFHVFRFLMDPAFARAYEAFITCCFREWGAMGTDAAIRADVRRQRAERGEQAWHSDWERFFCGPDDVASDADLEATYTSLMNAFAADLGLSVRGA